MIRILVIAFATICGLTNFMFVLGGYAHYEKLYPEIFEKGILNGLMMGLVILFSLAWPILCWFALNREFISLQHRYAKLAQKGNSEQGTGGNAI